jgi:hypothetical protein
VPQTPKNQILIQHRTKKKFFKGVRAWVKKPDKAKGFASALSAFNFVQVYGLSDVEIVLKSEGDVVRNIIKRETTIGNCA